MQQEYLEAFNKLKGYYLILLGSPYSIPEEQHTKLIEDILASPEEPNIDDYRVIRDILELNSELVFRAVYHKAFQAEENYTRACLEKYYNDISYTIDYLLNLNNEES